MQKLTVVEHATSPETPDGPAPGFPAESWQEWADACFTHDEAVGHADAGARPLARGARR